MYEGYLQPNLQSELVEWVQEIVFWARQNGVVGGEGGGWFEDIWWVPMPSARQSLNSAG